MEPTLVISAASALAYVSTAASGALPPFRASQPESGYVVRVVPPVIELSVYPIQVEPQLESVIYSSMSRDFERRYAL
jgi:hypothetical protein